jgi:hypothetical protein
MRCRSTQYRILCVVFAVSGCEKLDRQLAVVEAPPAERVALSGGQIPVRSILEISRAAAEAWAPDAELYKLSVARLREDGLLDLESVEAELRAEYRSRQRGARSPASCTLLLRATRAGILAQERAGCPTAPVPVILCDVDLVLARGTSREPGNLVNYDVSYEAGIWTLRRSGGGRRWRLRESGTACALTAENVGVHGHTALLPTVRDSAL